MKSPHDWLTPELLERARVFMLGSRGFIGRGVLAAELGLTAFKAKVVIDALKADGVQSKSLSSSKAPRDTAQPKSEPRETRETPRSPPPPQSERTAWTEDVQGETASVGMTGTSSRVDSLERLLELARVDLTEWEVVTYKVNVWEMGSVPRVIGSTETGWSRASSEPVTTPLYQVSASLKRRTSGKTLEGIKADALEAMASHAVAYPRRGPVVVKRDPHMAVIGIPDLHIGKLAWASETGEGWNMEMAVTAFTDALEGLLESIAARGVERIVFPVGNDLIHVDSSRGMTTKGTPQDVAHRYRKVFNVAREAMVRGIDRLSDVAPVTVLSVPGNHARESELTLTEVLGAWYRNSSEVTVDAAPTPRKYLEYGVNLLGFTHGDEEKHSSLPQIMALEAKKAWAVAEHREWFLGHFHRKRESHYLPLNEEGGVRVRIMPALTATDAWHAMKGYVGGIRAAEAYLFHKTRGCIATFSEPYRGA